MPFKQMRKVASKSMTAASAVLGVWVDFAYTFRICLNDVPPITGLNWGWGC